MDGFNIVSVITMLLLILTRVIEGMIWDDDARMRFMIASNSVVLFIYLVFVICASM